MGDTLCLALCLQILVRTWLTTREWRVEWTLRYCREKYQTLYLFFFGGGGILNLSFGCNFSYSILSEEPPDFHHRLRRPKNQSQLILIIHILFVELSRIKCGGRYFETNVLFKKNGWGGTVIILKYFQVWILTPLDLERIHVSVPQHRNELPTFFEIFSSR